MCTDCGSTVNIHTKSTTQTTLQTQNPIEVLATKAETSISHMNITKQRVHQNQLTKT
jgi:hypothetical protein